MASHLNPSGSEPRRRRAPLPLSAAWVVVLVELLLCCVAYLAAMAIAWLWRPTPVAGTWSMFLLGMLMFRLLTLQILLQVLLGWGLSHLLPRTSAWLLAGMLSICLVLVALGAPEALEFIFGFGEHDSQGQGWICTACGLAAIFSARFLDDIDDHAGDQRQNTIT